MDQLLLEATKKNIFFFGHHKCATNWMRSVLGDICSNRGWNLLGQYGSPKSDLHFSDADTTLHCYWNSKTADLNNLPLSCHGFHLIRDPRDALVSAYWSWKNTHSLNRTPWLVKERQILNELNIEEGMLHLVNRVAMLQQLEGWLPPETCNILTIRYEELLADTTATYQRVFSFLDEPITDKEVSALVLNHSFKNITGRDPGQEDRNSHFRQGTAGDWQNYFTDNIKMAFKDQHGESLILLGYEKDQNW